MSTTTTPTMTTTPRDGVLVITCSDCPAWWNTADTGAAATFATGAHLDDHVRWAEAEAAR